MFRMCDAALVASLLAVGPVLAGTPIAKSTGMEMPVTVVSPQIEVAPAATAPTAPVVPAAPAAPAAGAAAAPAAEPSFEALIADFRWGWPEMGQEPHLPIPPPHRMRSEDLEPSGEDAPVDGNSGNALPLHLLQLPLPASPEAGKLPASPQVGPSSDKALPAPTPNLAPGAAKPAAPATANVTAQIPSHEAAAPAPSDVDPAMLQQMMRKLASTSAGEFNAATAAAPESRGAVEHRPATAESRLAATTAQTTMPAAAAAPPATAPALSSSIERAIAAAHADARARNPRAEATHAQRSMLATAGHAAAQGESGLQPAAAQGVGANLDALRLEIESRESFGSNLPRDVSRPQAESTAAVNQTFTLTAAASQAPGAAASPASARADAPVLDLRTPVQQPEWAQGLGEKVVWLTQSDVNSAQIRLNPAHLGPVEVQVSIEKDQATVSFVAQHAATREALEAAAPRLRDMLQTQGFGSVNVDISQHSAGHRTAHEQRQSSSERNGGWQPEEKRDAGYAPSRPAARSALDTFA